jgi:hypothetical protein
VYEPVPPVAVKLALYALATTALGTDKVETLRLLVVVGVVIVIFIGCEVPLRFPGLYTVMLAVLLCATSARGTLAHRCVVLVYLVAKDAPFHCTIDADENLDPVAVRVNPPPPAATLLGDTLLKTGTFFRAAATSGATSQSNTRTRYNVVFIAFTKASPG